MSARVMLVYNTMKYLHRMRVDLIIELQNKGYEVIAVAPFDDTERYLSAMGVTCVNWHLVGHSVNPIRELRALTQLWRIVRRYRPTHVFGFTIKPVIYGSLVARWHGGIMTVSMITGLGVLFAGNTRFQRFAQLMAGRLYRLALHDNSAVFVQNDEHAAYMRQSGFIAPDRVVRIQGSGINLTQYLPSVKIDHSRSLSGIESTSDEVVFLMASRLLRHKGVEEYIRACSSVVRGAERGPKSGQGIQARFLLAGAFVTGPSAITPEQLDRWLDSSPVEYLGEIDDMVALLQTCHVLVLPSYYPEGTPRAILEGLACGLAIITTDTPGCRDTVIMAEHSDDPAVSCTQGHGERVSRRGRNGYLVPKQSEQGLVEGLVEGMGHLADDPMTVRVMGDVSRTLAEARYDVRDVNRIILEKMKI